MSRVAKLIRRGGQKKMERSLAGFQTDINQLDSTEFARSMQKGKKEWKSNQH